MCRKLIPLIAAILLLLPISCSRRQSPAENGGERRIIGSVLTYDTSAPVNGGNPISLVFWTQVDYEDLYRTAVEDYMKIHPNVSIELVPASFKDHFSKLQVALAAGIGPDIFHIHNSYRDSLLPHMAPYPHEIIPYESLMEDFSQVPQHMVNGSIYFIDTGFMTSSIYYNREIWKEEGLTESDFPQTWEDLSALAKKLTIRDEKGNILRSGFNPNGQGFELFTAMNLQKGQRMFSPVDLKSPLIDTEKSRESLAFIASLYGKDGVADMNFPLFHESFGAGSSVMIYSWGWTINWLNKNFPSTRYGTFPTPVWNDYPDPRWIDRNNRESTMAVSKYGSDEKRKAAFDFILFFLASDSYLREINIRMGTIPSKKVLMKDFPESFSSMMDRTVWPGIYPSFYESEIIDKLIDPVIIDGMDIGTSLKNLQAQLEPRLLRSTFLSME